MRPEIPLPFTEALRFWTRRAPRTPASAARARLLGSLPRQRARSWRPLAAAAAIAAAASALLVLRAPQREAAEAPAAAALETPPFVIVVELRSGTMLYFIPRPPAGS